MRDIDDRITLEAEAMFTKLGINGDFHIEAVGHRLAVHSPLQTTWHLSKGDADPGYWILDVDLLGTGTVLGY